jgi:phospholipase C
MRFVALVISLCLLAACGPKAVAKTPAKLTPTPSRASSPTPATASHVFVIVMENRTYNQVVDSPYISLLAGEYAVATNYHSVASPSLPNYLALTSGDTWGIRDNEFHRLPAGGIGAQLSDAGIDWRAYMEGMSGGCLDSPPPYALKHNPFAYYGGACPPQVVPFTNFATDMSHIVPRFVWITPDLCHDGHDCATAAADAWLSQTVPVILNSGAWKKNGLLIITWDEGSDDDHVLTLVIRPNSVAQQSDRSYDHYSLLATIEDQLRLPHLGQAAQATPMTH